MKLWPIFFLIPQALPSVMAGLPMDFVSPFGDAALADGLWEVAELHYQQKLADASLTPEAKAQIAIRLAESLIHQGNSADALELLNQSFVAKNSETPFWKAQALAGQNRFSEAIEILSTVMSDPKAPHRVESGLTMASLSLSLGKTDVALDTLGKLLPESDATTAAEVQLNLVEILLDLKRIAEARQAMPAEKNVTEKNRARAAFLNAQLLLNEGQFVKAEIAFQALVNHPQGQSNRLYHSSVIGLADALQSQGNNEVAISSLLTFLQGNPESKQLSAIFQRILRWMPEKPTPTDPTLDQLAQWITPSTLPAIGPIANGADAVSAWPIYSNSNTQSDLLAQSLFTRACGLSRIDTPSAKAEATLLLHRLRIEYPDHELTQRALYQQARWNLDSGNSDAAFAVLDTLRDAENQPILKGKSAFLKARAVYLQGDPQQAIELFNEAALNLTGSEARTAIRQAAIARLRSGDVKGITLVRQQGAPPDKELEADLELEKALSTTPPDAARIAIADFLTRFPDHPRAAEAHLMAAESALAVSPPDILFARDQLGALTGNSSPDLAPRIALANLHLADISNNSESAIAAARSIIDTYPTDPVASEAAFTLGRNLFQAGSYTPARLVLEKLAASDSNPNRAQVAWLLAARAAALGGTSQSKEEALILFDKATESNGPVNSIAHLEKGRHLIDMYRLAEASQFLDRWMKTLPANDPLQLPAGLLLGETLYAQGSANPASLVDALAVYDKLLVHAQDQPAIFNRLQYLRGTTLEQLPDEKDPTRKREKQAFQAYHSVLETTVTPKEWEYFERCGFRAIALLEKAQRWPVAVSVAQKIASFKGPRAEEAATHARQLQLKHMIWED